MNGETNIPPRDWQYSHARVAAELACTVSDPHQVRIAILTAAVCVPVAAVLLHFAGSADPVAKALSVTVVATIFHWWPSRTCSVSERGLEYRLRGLHYDLFARLSPKLTYRTLLIANADVESWREIDLGSKGEIEIHRRGGTTITLRYRLSANQELALREVRSWLGESAGTRSRRT